MSCFGGERPVRLETPEAESCPLLRISKTVLVVQSQPFTGEPLILKASGATRLARQQGGGILRVCGWVVVGGVNARKHVVSWKPADGTKECTSGLGNRSWKLASGQPFRGFGATFPANRQRNLCGADR